MFPEGKTKRLGWLALGGIIAAGALLAFRRDLAIAYHKNRLMDAATYYGFVSGQPEPAPQPTRLQLITMAAFRIDSASCLERMEHHEAALLEIGYLRKQEFVLSRRMMTTNLAAFYHHVTNTSPVGSMGWWAYSSPASNKLVVTATMEYLPKWKALIEEFDREADGITNK